MTRKSTPVANTSEQSPNASLDLFDLLRARGFAFLPARDPGAFVIGHMRYPTFTRDGVRVAVQSARCLEEDRGMAMIYESERTWSSGDCAQNRVPAARGSPGQP
jgi:hypothetical protein